jgi:hypothetical protein
MDLAERLADAERLYRHLEWLVSYEERKPHGPEREQRLATARHDLSRQQGLLEHLKAQCGSSQPTQEASDEKRTSG